MRSFFFGVMMVLSLGLFSLDTASVDWNNRGMGYYELEDWERAYQAFTQALEMDPGNYLAWFNRACVIARSRRDGAALGTSMDIYLDLQQSMALHSGRRSRVAQDSDLEEFRQSLLYPQLMGKNLLEGERLHEILSGAHLRATLLRGRIGLEGSLDLNPDLGFQVHFPSWGLTLRGQWEVEGGALLLHSDNGMELVAYFDFMRLVVPDAPWGRIIFDDWP